MIDTQTVKREHDILTLAGRDTELKRVAGTAGGEYQGACPFCGGRDRFRAQPGGGRDGLGFWACRVCEPKGGDVIAYVMKRDNCNFTEAVEKLSGGAMTTHSRRTPAPPSRPNAPELNQAAALRVIEECEADLWSERCAPVRDYLRTERGLWDEVIRLWRIGYCSTGRRDEYGRTIAGLYVPRGIIIPNIIGGAVWALKVRLMPGVPFQCAKCKAVLTTPGRCPHCGENNKMRGVKGNRAALFGAETLPGMRAAVLCEGEFDMLLLNQCAGDLVGVATFGSARPNLDVATWASYLLPIAPLFIAYDSDDTGERGADGLMGLTQRARRLVVPMKAKDITDSWKAGADLRQWVVEALNRGHLPQRPAFATTPADPITAMPPQTL